MKQGHHDFSAVGLAGCVCLLFGVLVPTLGLALKKNLSVLSYGGSFYSRCIVFFIKEFANICNFGFSLSWR